MRRFPLGRRRIVVIGAGDSARALSRHGEQAADVVIVLGGSKNTLRLFGPADCVTRVRAAMFNAAMNWKLIELD